MIGSRTKKMPSKQVCTGCEVLSRKQVGGTKRFPNKWFVNYCAHPDLIYWFIKRGIPYTPKWCPANNQKNNQKLNPKQAHSEDCTDDCNKCEFAGGCKDFGKNTPEG